jgi:hypothetical protein
MITIQISLNEKNKIEKIENFLKSINTGYKLIDSKFVTTVESLDKLIFPSIDEFTDIEDYFKNRPNKKRKPKYKF